jgi:hypothetical protein
MTEGEWLDCADPQKMLTFLREKVSSRKLQLFACACCRRIWNLLSDGRSQPLVEAVEQHVDGLATVFDVSSACEVHESAYSAYDFKAPWYAAGYASSPTHFAETARAAAQAVACAAWWDSIPEDDPIVRVIESAASHAEAEAQCKIVLDIFGDPFCPVHIDPSWRAWNDGTALKLAQSTYDDRAFDRLPILADALEEARCRNAEILAHCRGTGPHVRGCWVVDLVLGKE